MKSNPFIIAFIIMFSYLKGFLILNKNQSDISFQEIKLELTDEQKSVLNNHKDYETFNFHRGEQLRTKIGASKIINGQVLYMECYEGVCDTIITLVFENGQIVESIEKRGDHNLKYSYDSEGKLTKHGKYSITYKDDNQVFWSNGIERENRKISYLNLNCKSIVLGSGVPRFVSDVCFNSKNLRKSIADTTYSGGKVINTLTQEFKYDSNNNIVNATFVNHGRDGELIINASNRFEYNNDLIDAKYVSYSNMSKIDSTKYIYKNITGKPLVIEKQKSERGRSYRKSDTYSFDSKNRLIMHSKKGIDYKLEYIES